MATMTRVVMGTGLGMGSKVATRTGLRVAPGMGVGVTARTRVATGTEW